MEQTYSKEVGMTLTIGQSLTPSQVRDLPDGAVVTFEDSAGQKCNWYAWNSASREQLCVILEYSVRTSATLVSLPSIEPKAKPASEIEKEAAIALVFRRAGQLASECRALVGSLDHYDTELYYVMGVNSVCVGAELLRAAESYAKSIGAIE